MKISKSARAVIAVLTALFLIGICVENLFGRIFYDLDMYIDSRLADYMWNQKTLFPDNWIFGNNLYIISTPVLSALLHGFVSDSILSLGLASCIMTFFVLASFYWCIKPFAEKQALSLGILCLLGGAIISNSAARSYTGLQLFYTMASYYSCYLITALLSLGLYLRIRQHLPYSRLFVAAVLVLNILVSMHSLREIAVLNIPLLACSLLDYLKKKDLKPLYFSSVLMLGAVIGTVLIRLTKIPQVPFIDHPHLDFRLSQLASNLLINIKCTFQISGLAYFRRESVWMPLAIIAAFYLVLNCRVLYEIFKRRDHSALASLIVFCWTSLIVVFLIGVFVFSSMHARYYFMYYLLTTFSTVYVVNSFFSPKSTLILLLACCAISFAYNFIPDIYYFNNNYSFAKESAKELNERNIKTLFIEWETRPIVSIFSDSPIQTYGMNFDVENDAIVRLPYFMQDINYEENTTLLCISDWNLKFVQKNCPRLFDNLLLQEESFKFSPPHGTTLRFFQIPKPSFLTE